MAKFQYDVKNLKRMPECTGVYLMKGRRGEVLYVGKAKNLKKRLKQYFQKGHDGRYQVPFLIQQVVDIDTIVVTSEKEALLLENTLIKKHKPKYNVFLKDDKSYIAIKITHKHKWPMIKLVRYKGRPKDDALYFGPYTSANSARQTFDLLNRLFPLRQCSDQELKRRSRPCILYDMGRCIAPCVGFCTKEEYDKFVKRTVKFLRGQDKEVLKELYQKMHAYSEKMEFEKAQALLKTIKQIEDTVEKQIVDKPLGKDTDAVGLYQEAQDAVVVMMEYRGGKLQGVRHFHITNTAQDSSSLITSVILQHYEKLSEGPHEVLLPLKISDAKQLQEVISEGKKRQIHILCPQKGEKFTIISMANENAKSAFHREMNEKARMQKLLLQMQSELKLANYPGRVECFDTSNIQGASPVASMVVFSDGEKDKSRYRKYALKSVDTSDDYAAMLEVLSRRYQRAREENDLPDLIIVDGGKGQLNIALKVMQKLDIVGVDVIALAKEMARHDKGLTKEQIFLPYIKEPIRLKQNNPVLFLLQKVRDEAHRFAITFHRKKRMKKTLKSALDEIPGIGPKKKILLIRAFGSIAQIASKNKEELTSLDGISEKDAESILCHFEKKSP